MGKESEWIKKKYKWQKLCRKKIISPKFTVSEMQIKTTVKYCLSIVRMFIVKDTKINTSKNMGERKPHKCIFVGIKMSTAIRENRIEVLHKNQKSVV